MRYQLWIQVNLCDSPIWLGDDCLISMNFSFFSSVGGDDRVMPRHCWYFSYLSSHITRSDFGVDHLVMSICRVFSCVVGRGCLLWPVHFLGKTLFVFALLHSVFQGQICLLLQVFLDFLFLHSSPLYWKGHLFRVLVLEGLVGLHRTIQLHLLQRYWLGHRLGLLWYLMVCLENEIILSFLRLHPSTAFQTLLLTMMATPFLLRDSCPQKKWSGHHG